jgi:hypothetical protein
MVERNGYRHLGLRATHLPAQADRGGTYGEAVERAERRAGSTTFHAKGFAALHPDIAGELAHTYLSLRRMIPAVIVDHLDVRAAMGDDSLALSWSYDHAFPLLRRIHDEEGICDPQEAVALLDNRGWRRVRGARSEIAWHDVISNLGATGTIELNRTVTSHAGYRRIETYWAKLRERRLAAGQAPRHPGLDVTPGAYLLCHEYGHLVEAELWRQGNATVEHVYGTLSEVVHGKTVTGRSWRYHLAHYPAGAGNRNNLPYTPSQARRNDTRRLLRHDIGNLLGKYATVNRDELFAEAFAFSICSGEQTRNLLEPFLTETVAALGRHQPNRS